VTTAAPSSLPALPRLTLTETRLFLRDPTAIVFGPLLAPALALILGFVPPFRVPDPGLGGLRVIDLYVPILVGVAVASLALTGSRGSCAACAPPRCGRWCCCSPSC
jgi:ABC-2 type transport system permease protein